MALNWRDNSVISVAPVRARSAGTRRSRSPSASARAASVSRRSGAVKRRASNDETTIASTIAPSEVSARKPTTAAIVLARVVYGAERLTSSIHVGFTPAGSPKVKTSR